jgi:hypothetical protein
MGLKHVTKSELLFALAGMVETHCVERENVYETGWLGVNKEAMQLLVRCGVMKLVKDGYGRGYWAKFIHDSNSSAESVADVLYDRRTNKDREAWQ